jgi:hypothetical protein
MSSFAGRLMGLAALAAALGCGAASTPLHIDARGFAGFRLSVRVIESTAAKPLACHDLEYGEIELEDALLSAREQLHVSSGGDNTLRGLDQSGHFLFVVDAVDPEGVRRGIGCTELDRYGAASELSVALEEIAVARVTAGLALEASRGGRLDAPATLSIADVDGQALAGREARFTISGGRGEATSGSATSDEKGALTIDATPPSVPGPFALDVAVRWTGHTPKRISGFVRPDAVESDLASSWSIELGRFRDPTQMSIAVADNDAHKVNLCRIISGRIRCDDRDAIAIGPWSGTASLVRLDGAELDRVLVVASNGWWEVGAMDPQVVEWQNIASVPPLTPAALIAAGKCPESDAVIVSGPMIEIHDRRGRVQASPVESLAAGEIIASGCASTPDGKTLFRAYVTAAPASPASHGGFVATVVAESEMSTLVSTEWPGAPNAFAFVPDLDGHRLLIGTGLELEDRVLTRELLDPSGRGLSLTRVAYDVTGAAPVAIAGGDVDADRVLDLAAILSEGTPLSPAQATPPRLWVGLGKKVREVRISGAFKLRSDCASALAVGDTDGDRFDEIAIDEGCAFPVLMPPGAPPTTHRLAILQLH